MKYFELGEFCYFNGGGRGFKLRKPIKCYAYDYIRLYIEVDLYYPGGE